MFKKKWALCWDGPCRRRTPRRNPDGRRHPSGPHGGRLCRLRFPWRGPRFLLSSASRPGPARIAGARAGFAIGAAGPRSCPQSNRTRLCVDRLARRAISVPLAPEDRVTGKVVAGASLLSGQVLADPNGYRWLLAFPPQQMIDRSMLVFDIREK